MSVNTKKQNANSCGTVSANSCGMVSADKNILGQIWITIALFVFGLSGSPLLGQKPEVFWAGITYRGGVNASDQYKYLFPQIEDSQGDLQKFLKFYIRDNVANFTNIDLKYSEVMDEGSKYALSLVLSDEIVSTASIGDSHKLFVQLFFEIVVLDLQESKLINSIPIIIELIDGRPHPYEDSDITSLILDMVNGEKSQLVEVIASKANKVRAIDSSTSTIQVKSMEIGDKVKSFSEPAGFGEMAYKRVVAQTINCLLSSQLNVAILPYSINSVNAKMALRLANQSKQFTIPEPTYAIDINLEKYVKAKSKKSTDAQTLWLFGAYMSARIYEPSFNIEYFNQEVKAATSKTVPSNNDAVDDFANLSDTLKKVILNFADQTSKDKNVQQKVFEKCKL